MTIHVRHIDEETVEITLIPGWLARLFGAKVRRGTAFRDLEASDYVSWYWKATEREVGRDIEHLIECSPVDDLPPAKLLGGAAP